MFILRQGRLNLPSICHECCHNYILKHCRKLKKKKIGECIGVLFCLTSFVYHLGDENTSGAKHFMGPTLSTTCLYSKTILKCVWHFKYLNWIRSSYFLPDWQEVQVAEVVVHSEAWPWPPVGPQRAAVRPCAQGGSQVLELQLHPSHMCDVGQVASPSAPCQK